MYSGYLTKRSAPISPPPMQKMFCVLWGTMLFDYDSEEDAKNSMCPKVVTEILGISEWDGKGRANSYPFGFLLVTHTGGTYYVSVPTVKDRDEWILHVKRALECIFANPDVVPFKPSKIIQNRPSLASNMVCPRSHHTLSASGTYYCKACGRGYYSSEYISDTSTMLQIGVEDSEKVCLDCKNAQLVVLWIKSLNYAHVMNLHEMTPQVLSDVNKFKNSFKLRRRLSSRLEMAADLWTQGNISAEEFEELRNVDHAYRRELVYEESRRLKSAVDAFGEDMQTILGILMNPHLTDPGGRTSYYNIVLRILEIADNSPDLIDFYFPQIIQVHLQETRLRTMESLVKVDLLQQALLVIAQKYPALGLKLAWSLLASVGDYAEKRVTQAQYAACTCLLLQLEIAVTGVVSSIADVPACRLLSKVFRGSAHQQQEIGFEISALFLVRRRLQEVFDEEEERRRVRTTNRYSTEGDDEIGETVVITSPTNSPAPSSEKERKASHHTGKKHNKRHSYSNKEITCLDLLYQLGVGQAGGSGVRAASAPSFSYVSDADSDDDADYEVSGSDEENTGESGSAALNAKCHRPSLNNFTTHQWSGFAEQLDFLDRVNDVVEGLRFIDRTARTEALVKEVTKWNEEPLRYLGWDPTTIAGEPHYRITRIITEECRVFRTKARAPSMLVCEVVRDDLASQGHYANNHHVCAPTDSESTAGLDLSLEGGSSREKDAHALGESIPDNTSSNIDNTHSNNHSNVSNSSCHLLVSVGSSDSMSASGPTLVHTKLIAERPGDEKVSDQLSQIEELVGSSMTHTIAELHKHETHTHEKQLQLDVGSGLPLARSQSLKTSPVNIASKHKSVATAGMSSRISNSSLVDIAHSTGNSSSSSHSARPASMVMPKRKTSTFLSSNRLAVNAEDMMRSTTSSPSNTVGAALKLSAVALHSSNAQNNMNLAQSNTGGAHNSPAFRMTHSGKFKPGSVPSSSGVASLSGQGSDEDTGSVLNDSDNASLSSFSQDDTVSVRSSGTATQETAQVTKKVLTSAQRLLQSGKIDAKEYEQLLASDMQYHEETAREEAQIAKCRVESAFGESWLSKKEKYLGDRMHVHHAAHEGAGHFVASINGGFEVEDEGMVDPTDWPAWDLRCFIVKSNDDLRQEVCCLQLMQLCKEVFEHFGLSQMLWLKPYRIISTGATTGIVHVLTDAASLDALKKTPGFTTLNNYFKKTYDSSAERLAQAKRNFTISLAAYSLFSYILLIKDRHNGNLLIDAEGHIIHIDFGFLLSIAPGGSFSVETAPFKLTEEMVEVMGGLDSPLFGEFVNAFTKGFIALQANAENIVGALQIISLNSTFPCFAGKQASVIIDKLRQRFRTELSVGDAVKHCLDLITNSYGNYGTRQYDTFQYLTNGIFP